MDRAFIYTAYSFANSELAKHIGFFLLQSLINFDLVFNTKLQVFINKLESFLVHNMTSLIKINMHQWYMCINLPLYSLCKQV